MQISSKQSKAGIEESLLKAKHYKMSCDIMMSTKWEGQSKQGIESHSVSETHSIPHHLSGKKNICKYVLPLPR